MTFNNLDSQGQRFDITITENRNQRPCRSQQAHRRRVELRHLPAHPRGRYARHGRHQRRLLRPLPFGLRYQHRPRPCPGPAHVRRHRQLRRRHLRHQQLRRRRHPRLLGAAIWIQSARSERGQADPDGDGFTNLQEFLAGTNPTSSSSLMRITSITRTGNVNTITWSSVNSKTYHLQSTDSITGTFTDVAGPDITASGPSTSTTDTTVVWDDSTGYVWYRRRREAAWSRLLSYQDHRAFRRQIKVEFSVADNIRDRLFV